MNPVLQMPVLDVGDAVIVALAEEKAVNEQVEHAEPATSRASDACEQAPAVNGGRRKMPKKRQSAVEFLAQREEERVQPVAIQSHAPELRPVGSGRAQKQSRTKVKRRMKAAQDEAIKRVLSRDAQRGGRRPGVRDVGDFGRDSLSGERDLKERSMGRLLRITHLQTPNWE
jgi:hypothetical protein